MANPVTTDGTVVTNDNDFLIAVATLGVASLILALVVIFLIFWVYTLSKKIKKLEPFVNFKIQRPHLTTPERPMHFAPAAPMPPLPRIQNLNPISNQTSHHFDNNNFSFGTPTSSAFNPPGDPINKYY